MTRGRPPARLYGESVVLMFAVAMALRFISFGKLARWAVGPTLDRPSSARGLIVPVQRTIGAWSRRVPWRAMCIEQGLVAARMLSRRGAPVTLAYGAAQIDGHLKAHVWVHSGEQAVVGCENSADFVLLSRFSNDSSSSSVQS